MARFLSFERPGRERAAFGGPFFLFHQGLPEPLGGAFYEGRLSRVREGNRGVPEEIPRNIPGKDVSYSTEGRCHPQFEPLNGGGDRAVRGFAAYQGLKVIPKFFSASLALPSEPEF